jgi:hypothetical protein
MKHLTGECEGEDEVSTLQEIIEKHKEFNKKTHLFFIDFEKAFDKVNRNKLWKIVEEKQYPKHLYGKIQNLYKIIMDWKKEYKKKNLVNTHC